MAEIRNANEVSLTIKAVGIDGSLYMTDRARLVVDDFNFTISEDNQSLSGVGNHTPVGVTRGNVEYEFSFTLMGEDGELLSTIATENGRSREIEFTASTDSFVAKMMSGYLTSLSYDGSDNDAVEWSAEGIAVSADLHERS